MRNIRNVSRCACGDQDLTSPASYTISLTKVHYFDGAEIGRIHGAIICSWGYECQDCWTERDFIAGQSGVGFNTENDAVAGLRRHLRFYCPPNWQSYTDEERAEALRLKRVWERLVARGDVPPDMLAQLGLELVAERRSAQG